jgi:phosphoribosylformylglycinamidine synthase
MVEILDSKSLFFNEMAGSFLPIVTSNGEGRAQFDDDSDHKILKNQQQTCIRSVIILSNRRLVIPRIRTVPREDWLGYVLWMAESTILMPHP